MQPSQKQIADLFSVVFNVNTNIERPSRKTRGETAAESAQLGSQSITDGDYEKAIEHFRRAVDQHDPTDIQARVDLGGAYEVADMAPQAFRQYQKALKIKGDSPEPRVALAQVLKRNGHFKDSLRQIEEAIKLEPYNAFFHFKLAELFRELNDRENALRAAQSAVASAPSDSFYHFWMGDLLITMGRFEEALDALRAAIELSPGDDYLYLRAASAFWGCGRKQEAVKAVRLASDLDPDKDLYHGVLELLLHEMDLDEEADLEAKRSSQMDTYDRETLKRIADELGLYV